MIAPMIRIGVIGYGYWGPNLARNFATSDRMHLAAIVDRDADRRAIAARRQPDTPTHADARAVFDDPSIDAVAIATPVASHFALTRAALEAGKHVWVEKPIASTSDEARALIDLAAAKKRVLLVDHTFLYTPAVRKIREIVTSGRLGRLYYYDSVRVNLGLFQEDVNVLWDLAVHDLTIMDHVLDAPVRAVSATGAAHVPGRPVNQAYLTCFLDDDLLAHVHVNWLAPAKVRRTLIGGDRQMVIYDDLEPSEKVKVYDRGITVENEPDAEQAYALRVGYRTGDLWSPHLANGEALATETEHFADCIEHGTRPLSSGETGLRVVEILEAADRSLAARGAPVEL